MSRDFFLGIDIGGTKSSVVIGDDRGEIIDKASFPTEEPKGPEQCVNKLLETSEQILAKHSIRITATGIACGSPLDPELGIIQSPAQLQSWKDVQITKIFQEMFRVPAFLDNDANAGALAEFCFGAGKGCRHMAFLTFGTGMGAGFVLNGDIYRGANCYAGEVGHIRLEPHGPIGCRKTGSFEGFCSGAGIAQIAKAEVMSYTGKTLLGPTPTTRDVGEAAEKGDELAMRVFEISGRYLGKALAILLDTLNLERIIIGSIFLRCEKFLRPAMEKALREEALPQVITVCRILPAGLGESVGDYAALSVAYNQMRKIGA
jgi:glucokinase